MGRLLCVWVNEVSFIKNRRFNVSFEGQEDLVKWKGVRRVFWGGGFVYVKILILSLYFMFERLVFQNRSFKLKSNGGNIQRGIQRLDDLRVLIFRLNNLDFKLQIVRNYLKLVRN